MSLTHPPGLFSWTDISLPDPASGRSFYSSLFGWEAEDQHDPEGNYIYTMFKKDGESVAGMGPQPPGMADSGIPPMWNSYVAVDDVDRVVERVIAQGGSVVLPVMEVMTAGRMAVVADPEGGVVSLWESGDHRGAGIFNSHGAMTWNELATRDTEGAKAFYGAVFGWDFESMPGPNEYWLIKCAGKVEGDADADDDYNGGLMAMDENWPAEMPPHWMVYFAVDNADDAITKLKELGGSVSVPAFDTPAGRMAVVGDPQGGTFMVMAQSQAPSED
jgi:predicted enzyme related to lactoylglutathione lyase